MATAAHQKSINFLFKSYFDALHPEISDWWRNTPCLEFWYDCFQDAKKLKTYMWDWENFNYAKMFK